ncbi:hypothetical protein MTBSS4_90082 [Magnetospirillum sp. SS-4]|nr:hypothetical protein MTBSS4_90082 [Magnetospirillum sp. SS-4]
MAPRPSSPSLPPRRHRKGGREMVPRRRLELPRHHCHTDLNRARLPIPPPGQVASRTAKPSEARRNMRPGPPCQR